MYDDNETSMYPANNNDNLETEVIYFPWEFLAMVVRSSR